MAGRGETMTTAEPAKAQAETGQKKRTHLRIGGPGILVGVLAVAVVVGAAIRIRRYRSSREARKRIQHSCRDDRGGGLRSVLQEDEDYPRCYTRDVAAEMVLSWMMEHDSVEHEIQTEEIGENEGDEACDRDHGQWMATEISESSAEEEEEEENPSHEEDTEEEDYDDAEDDVKASEADDEEDAHEVAGYKAEENDDLDDDDEDDDEDEEDKDEGECVVEKCEEESQGTEDSSMESNAEVEWTAEMKEWPLEIKEMKVSYHDGRIPKTQSCNFLNEVERTIPVKIKLRIWIWTTLMLLLLLLLSVTNQKAYVSLYH